MPKSPLTYVLHHNDPDGFGAAYAAFKALGKKNVVYIPVDYGMEQPVLKNKSRVYILDYSYPRAVLDSLVERMSFVQVIDHHKSAQIDLEGHPNAIFDMNNSGAGLAWDYFHPNTPRPDFINYIEDADLWRFNLPDSKFVKNSIYNIEYNLDVYIKEAKRSIKSRIKEGQIIQKVVDHNLALGFEYKHYIQVGEYLMLAVNSCLHMSEFGDMLCKHKSDIPFDFAGTYYKISDSMYKFSLRSNGFIDVSLVAKSFGGGGHKNAAGFEISIGNLQGHKLVRNSEFL